MHSVGRQGAARPERLGPRPRSLDAGLLPRQIRRAPGQPAQAGHGRCNGSGRRRKLGCAEPALWQTAFCRPDATSYRYRRARLPGARGGAAKVGRSRRGVAQPARLCRALYAARAGAGHWRAFSISGGGARFTCYRPKRWRGLLPGRNRPSTGAVFRQPRRQLARLGPGGLPARVGQAVGAKLPGLHAA